MSYIDQTICEGDRMLASDQASLALVRDLRVLLVDASRRWKTIRRRLGVAVVLTAADAGIQLPEC